MAIALLLLAPAAVRPAWPAGTALLEPDGRVFCSGRPGGRAVRAAVPDGRGGFLLVTTDDAGSGLFPAAESWDIGLIHLDESLRPLGVGDGLGSLDACGAIISGGRGAQAPSAALPWAGAGLLLVAEDESQGVARVILQAFDDDGAPRFGSRPIVISDPGIESRFPALIPDGTGGFLCAWSEIRRAVGGEDRLLLQRLSGGGEPSWAAPSVVTESAYLFSALATLAPDGEGGAYLTWSEARPDSETAAGYHPRLLRIGADGRPVWDGGARRLLEDGYADLDVRLATDGSGGVLAFFGAGPLRAQRFSPSGERLWGAGGIVLSDPAVAAPASAPEITEGGDGTLYVAWLQDGAGTGARVLVRRLARDGALPWPSPIVALDQPLAAGRPSLALLNGGSLAMAWEDVRQGPGADRSDIYAQVIDRRGRAKAPPDGAPVVTAAGRQGEPVLLAPLAGTAAEGKGGPAEVAVVWSDTRLASLMGPSASFFLQRLAFTSAPTLDPPAAALEASQGARLDLTVHGDDLQPGLVADAGIAVTILEATPAADSAEGPGDSLRLVVEIDPAAPTGTRDLGLKNPDGGSTHLPRLFTVRLDARRIDIDGSGRVDGHDLAVLARSFGRSRGEERYAPEADIDGSGQIDGADLALLASRFGSQAPGSAPAGIRGSVAR